MGDARFAEANGHKKTVHQRPGAKTCIYWLQGRCSRYPCPFLHGNPSPILQQQYNGVVPKSPHPCRPGNLVWRNPDTMGGRTPSACIREPGGPVGLEKTDVSVVVKDANEGSPSAPRQGEEAAVNVIGSDGAESLCDRGQRRPLAPGQREGAITVSAVDERKDVERGPPMLCQGEGAVTVIAVGVRKDVERGPSAPFHGEGVITVVAMNARKGVESPMPCQGEGPLNAARKGSEMGPSVPCQEEGATRILGPGGPCKDDEGGALAPLQGEGADIIGPHVLRGDDVGICKFFVEGRCTLGESCKFAHSSSVGDDFSFLTSLAGHQKAITGIALPSGDNKLYSGSTDGTARIWDCRSGKCIFVATLGAEVGCIISEGPWIFIGIPNAVKAYNTQTKSEMNLAGPLGLVYALDVGNSMLFAGVQDGSILAWSFGMEGNCFQPVTSLNGHRAAVVSLRVGATRLYSGSMDNTIRVWDIASLQCINTLTDHTEVVTSLLCWEQYLLSCSLDRTIKVWGTTESGGLEVKYTHNEEHGVLSLAGTPDAHGKPVLLCSCSDNTVHLYDLPSFMERGKIFSREEVRAIQTGPRGLFFTGDGTGELKVWKWLADNAES